MLKSSRLAVLGGIAAMGSALFGGIGSVDRTEVSATKRTPYRRDRLTKRQRENRDLRSPAGTARKIGHIGMGMHSSGRTALGGVSGITATPVEKGPARTLSVRDTKLTVAQGRRYKRMRPFERQRRLDAIFGMGA